MKNINLSSKYVRLGAYSSAGITGYLCYHLPNFTFIRQTQKLKQLYRNGEPVPVPPDIERLNEAVLNDLNWPEERRRKVKLFTNSELEVFHAGSVWKSFLGIFQKAIIGIPVNWSWSKDNSAAKDLQIKGEIVDLSTEVGQKLYNSFLLSDNAKKAALAQNYFYVSKGEPVVKGALTTSVITAGLIYINFLYELKVKVRLSHVPFQILILFLHFNIWYMGKGVYTSYLEKQADQMVATLGRSYVEGAYELHRSSIERNKALRAIAKEKNKSLYYTAYGDEKTIICDQHLPVTGRKEYFMQMLNTK